MKLDGTTMAITGAGGFIGLRMVERARARGLSVRGLELSSAAARRAEAAGAVTQRGDVCDPVAAEVLCRGADVVFHTAAIVEEVAPRGEENLKAGWIGSVRSWSLTRRIVPGWTNPAAISVRAARRCRRPSRRRGP